MLSTMSRGHHAHVSAAHGQRLAQLVAHRFQRGHQPVGTRILSSTMRTLSGCWRALSMSPALPKSTSMRSVPAETSVWQLRISKARDQRGGRGHR